MHDDHALDPTRTLLPLHMTKIYSSNPQSITNRSLCRCNKKAHTAREYAQQARQGRNWENYTETKQRNFCRCERESPPPPGTCVISAVSYRIISQDGRLKRIDAQQALPISLVTAAIGIISTAAAGGHLICTKHDRIGGLRRRTGSVKKLLLLTVSTSRT
jgi:hypothetical protein